MVSVSLAADDCADCVGSSMVKQIDIIWGKTPCPSNQKHHEIMSNIETRLQKLLRNITDEVPEDCNKDIAIADCEESDIMDDQSECYVYNSFYLAEYYRDIESCMKKQLFPEDSTMIVQLMTDAINGWDAIHSTC